MSSVRKNGRNWFQQRISAQRNLCCHCWEPFGSGEREPTAEHVVPKRYFKYLCRIGLIQWSLFKHLNSNRKNLLIAHSICNNLRMDSVADDDLYMTLSAINIIIESEN